MPEPPYFQEALKNFTYEAASGGAIRHLADLGLTPGEICERLDFPTPFGQVRQKVWERLLETGVILTREPGGPAPERYEYVREYDRYGRAGFRRVAMPSGGGQEMKWRRSTISCADGGQLMAFLQGKIGENGEEDSYAACDFGRISHDDPEEFEKILSALDGRDREYVEGMPWECAPLWHRLTPRMRDILCRLFSDGLCRPSCYFLKTGELVHICQAEQGKRR